MKDEIIIDGVKYLSTKRAAEYLKVTRAYLKQRLRDKIGYSMLDDKKVLYTQDSLDAWSKKRVKKITIEQSK